MDKLSIMEERKIGFFDKYLTLWVLLCIIMGIAVGKIPSSPASTCLYFRSVYTLSLS